MGVEIDISEKKRIENQLLKEKEFSDSIIDTANSLIVSLDLQGQIIFFNKKCEEVTGYNKSEIFGVEEPGEASAASRVVGDHRQNGGKSRA